MPRRVYCSSDYNKEHIVKIKKRLYTKMVWDSKRNIKRHLASNKGNKSWTLIGRQNWMREVHKQCSILFSAGIRITYDVYEKLCNCHNLEWEHLLKK